MKKRGYWTKEKCQEKSLKCINRDQFKNKYRSAYNSAYKNKWLDEICYHMSYESHVENKYWTKEKCYNIAILCNSRSEFYKKYRSSYDSSLKNGWLDDICSHMEVCGNLHSRLVYLFEFSDNSIYIGLTYNYNKRYKDHLINDLSSSVYKHIKKTGLIPEYKKLTDYIEIKTAMEFEIYYIKYYKELGYTILNKTKGGECGGCYSKYDYNACKLLAEKFTLKELRKHKRYAYEKIKKEGWISIFYISTL
jgi:predicted GIY-YIG superfamily endonuclease